MHFLRTLRPRIVTTTLLKIIFTYNGKTVDDESSARGSFVKKKILCFRKVFGETSHIIVRIIFPEANPGTL